MVDAADFVSDVSDWSTTIEWSKCESGSECGTFTVPFDYADPALGTFTLPVARHLATNPDSRVGVLLINPGGPGGSGVDFAIDAELWASTDLLEHFDIVGWDPRGVGGSRPAIDCVDTMYDYFALDPSPDDDVEAHQLLDGAERFAHQCDERSGPILPYVDTVRSAADIDVLRRAMGDDEVSYLGFSYGTALGATWISLFPQSVRAAVLDGTVDLTLGYIDNLVTQAAGFETSLNAYLDYCDAGRCLFMKSDETARTTFDRINRALDTNPLDNGDGLPATNQGVLSTAVAVSLYGDFSWSGLTEALAAADLGDGRQLLLLFDSYFGIRDGVPDDSIDAYFGVTCADRGENLDVASVLASDERLRLVAPRLGSAWIQEMLICANWPLPPAPSITIGADTATRTVVVGSTGDAATPLSGSVNMVRQLGDARLVTSNVEQHTSYGADGCVTRAVDEYLLTLVDGPDVVKC